jgi:TRAP-type C4-dicarboxylate transport system permease large subunit
LALRKNSNFRSHLTEIADLVEYAHFARPLAVTLDAACGKRPGAYAVTPAVKSGCQHPCQSQALYSFIVGLLLYREFDWARLKPMLIETASLSGAILLIIGAATGMAWALTQSGFSNTLAEVVTGLPGGRLTFIVVSVIGFIILGSVLEGIPAIVLFGPLLFPIAKVVGVHEVHYAMIVILSMGIGLFAPPFGVGYYTVCAVSKVNSSEGLRPLIPYMITLLLGVIIIAAIPWISIGFI